MQYILWYQITLYRLNGHQCEPHLFSTWWGPISSWLSAARAWYSLQPTIMIVSFLLSSMYIWLSLRHLDATENTGLFNNVVLFRSYKYNCYNISTHLFNVSSWQCNLPSYITEWCPVDLIYNLIFWPLYWVSKQLVKSLFHTFVVK